jgi:ABC-type branched-subunit amino acid transport system substrate-binding protein
MSTTDETTAKGEGQPPSRKPPGWQKAAKRYGPIVLVVVLIAAAVAIFGGGGGGDDDEASTDSGGSSVDELIESGPMTWQKAELTGEDVDWGPTCDTTTGRIMLPSVYAPPCVEPFSGDNGGETYQGVTADEIKIVQYITDPALDPLITATVQGAGAEVNIETAQETSANFVALYNKLFERYGRNVNVEVYIGTGAGSDLEAAKADAIAIAEKQPFAVIGGPAQASPVFASEIASHEIVCALGCAAALPEEIVNQYKPYLFQAGPTPDQATSLAAEAIGNLAGPGKAELAGDDATRAKDRVYGLLHYDTPDGDHEPVFEKFQQELSDNGIELATDVEFTLDLANSQVNARTNIGKLMEAGVTSIIYYGDPLTPASLTEEATAQGYYPEWLLGPSALMDTTIFARQTDVQQWKNGFGISLVGARGERSTNGAFQIHEWAYGEPPPNNTANVIEPPIRNLFTGIMLAGPDLNPETFRDALFRYPPSGGGPTEPLNSRGNHDIWPDEDWGGSDDTALIWFDPEATGEDEVGNEGTGMYRYAKMGERYTLGNLPTSFEEAGLFDDANSVTVYDQVPEEDRTPDYPPPE